MDYGSGRYEIHCKKVPPPVGGKLGEFIIPNAERKRKKILILKKMMEFAEEKNILNSISSEEIASLRVDIDNEEFVLFDDFKRKIEKIDPELKITKEDYSTFFSGNIFEIEYVSFKKLREQHPEKYYDIVIPIKEQKSGRFLISLSGFIYREDEELNLIVNKYNPTEEAEAK